MVKSRVTGYKKISWLTHAVLEQVKIEQPEHNLQTIAYWLSMNPDNINQLEKVGVWNNNQNDYGSNWPKIRRLVRIRDKFTCQVCGTQENDQAHHVHHITPFRYFSNSDQANQLDNLITLCPACHRRAEMKLRMRSGLAGLGYLMHHLAPLFLMCDIGDLGLHIEPQSTLTGGCPTIILFDIIPDGMGLSRAIFDMHIDLIRSAQELVSTCSCLDGCPSCVGPAGEQGVGGKRETEAIIQTFLGQPI